MRRHISVDTSGSPPPWRRRGKERGGVESFRSGHRLVAPFNALCILAGGRSFHPVNPEGPLAYTEVELLAPNENTIVIVQHCFFRNGESDAPCKLLRLPQSDPLLTNPLSCSKPVGSRRDTARPRKGRKASIGVDPKGADRIVAAVQREKVAAVVAQGHVDVATPSVAGHSVSVKQRDRAVEGDPVAGYRRAPRVRRVGEASVVRDHGPAGCRFGGGDR